MTAPVSFQSNRPGTAASVAIALIAGAAVLGLFTAGVTFFGLAIAFPIALPIAAQYHVVVSAADAALAERFAGLWWLFGALSVACLVGAAAVAVKAIQRLSPTDRD